MKFAQSIEECSKRKDIPPIKVVSGNGKDEALRGTTESDSPEAAKPPALDSIKDHVAKKRGRAAVSRV